MSYVGEAREGLVSALRSGEWKYAAVIALSQITPLNGDLIGIIIDYHESQPDDTG
jgi:hypothetical protein